MPALPEQPVTFRAPAAKEHPWWWRLEDSAGSEVSVEGDLGGQRFGTQADAETWVGERYLDLTDAGVDAVTLFEADREVYGPMSLHP